MGADGAEITLDHFLDHGVGHGASSAGRSDVVLVEVDREGKLKFLYDRESLGVDRAPAVIHREENGLRGKLGFPTSPRKKFGQGDDGDF